MQNIKVAIIPDSFKGSVSSSDICDIAFEVVKKYPQIALSKFMIADGGEGMLEAFENIMPKAHRVYCEICNPYFEKITASYLLAEGVAYIESAQAIGLSLVNGRANPGLTSTYGLGEMISNALQQGVSKIILGLGGSCTNDGGCGMAVALGYQFFDENNSEFIPTGLTLMNIKRIVKGSNFCDVVIEGLCDVDVPLFGINGAAFVFAEQKGADENMMVMLDQGLRHLARFFACSRASDFGVGAAGGLGFGLREFLNGELISGIDKILEINGFVTQIDNFDLVISGEGKIDSQTLTGKVIAGVGKLCKKYRKPLIVLVGQNALCDDDAIGIGVTRIIDIHDGVIDYGLTKQRIREKLHLIFSELNIEEINS